MDQSAEPATSPHVDGPVDISALERIEGELQAVERALEQIDEGIYEGFAGLDLLPADAVPHAPGPEAVEPEA